MIPQHETQQGPYYRKEIELSLQSKSQQDLYRVPDVDTSLHPETQQGLYRGQEKGAILQHLFMTNQTPKQRKGFNQAKGTPKSVQ